MTSRLLLPCSFCKGKCMDRAPPGVLHPLLGHLERYAVTAWVVVCVFGLATALLWLWVFLSIVRSSPTLQPSAMEPRMAAKSILDAMPEWPLDEIERKMALDIIRKSILEDDVTDENWFYWMHHEVEHLHRMQELVKLSPPKSKKKRVPIIDLPRPPPGARTLE